MTITSGAPSESLGLEALMMSNGAMIIVPDLIGFGQTADLPHPYCIPSMSASASFDMYSAVMEYLKNQGVQGAEDIPVYITGYSQGGMSALSEVRAAQEEYKGKVNLVSAYIGGGPYSMKAILDDWVETGKCGYSLSMALVVIGLKAAYPEIITGDYSDYYTDAFMEAGIVDKILSKKYSNNELIEAIEKVAPSDKKGFCKASDVLRKECLTPGEKRYEELARSAEECEMANGWSPEVPLYVIHCKGDTFVPYFNFELAQKGIGNEKCKFESFADPHMGPINHLVGGAIYYFRIILGDYLRQ